jgi:archaeal chaperonin
VDRTTLGPRGLDKLLVDQLGNRVITNDGYTVLVSLKTNHPISRLIVEIAERQEFSVGDGTTSTVIMAAEMLKEGYRVISEYNIHPSRILSEIDEATELITKYLQTVATPITSINDPLLPKVLKTTTASKLDGEQLSRLILKAVTLLSQKQRSDLRHGLVLLRRLGEDLFIDGLAIEELPIETSFIKELANPTLCLLKGNLKFPLEGILTKNDEDHQKQRQMLLSKLIDKGVNIILTNAPEIDQSLRIHLLAQKIAVIRVSTEELSVLSRSLDLPAYYGAQIISNMSDLLCFSAQGIEIDYEKKITILKAPQTGVAATLIIGGATVETSKERTRTCVDGISGAHFAIKGGIIPGGGIAELNAAKFLEKHMLQNNIQKVGYNVVMKGLESITRQILDNSGYNGYDMLVKLKSRPESQGINIETGEYIDMVQKGIIDPLITKISSIQIAVHIVKTILKIDKNLLKNDFEMENK